MLDRKTFNEKYKNLKNVDLEQVRILTEQAKGMYTFLESFLEEGNNILDILKKEKERQGAK